MASQDPDPDLCNWDVMGLSAAAFLQEETTLPEETTKEIEQGATVGTGSKERRFP